jgi:hypothetical protein
MLGHTVKGLASIYGLCCVVYRFLMHHCFRVVVSAVSHVYFTAQLGERMRIADKRSGGDAVRGYPAATGRRER